MASEPSDASPPHVTRIPEPNGAEARLLSRLLRSFCAKHPAEAADSGGRAVAEEARVAGSEEQDGDSEEATERSLIDAFLALAPASQESVARSLFAAPASLVDDFAQILQFFMRVIMMAHSAGHERRRQVTAARQVPSPGSDVAEVPLACSWERNGYISCVEYEQEERGDDDSPSASETIVFRFPTDVHACLAANYGSVKRLKCEEVWHGDHMAYRCRTCGLSDSSCMCLGCFDPDEHEGHDYRVYRCSSGGCCDCGDPLAWKPEGFCKKHQQNHSGARLIECPLDELEGRVVEDLVRCTVRFCADVMREVYVFCLRPLGTGYESDVFGGAVVRSLPKAGRRRSSFSASVQAHLRRLELALAWLQMLSMSCVHYRNIVSQSFFEPLPTSFQLEPAARASDNYVESNSSPGSRSSTQLSKELAEESEVGGNRADVPGADRLVALDVFLKAGVLLPVDMCDVLGVLYLKLLFDHDFKQKYTCHFVDWYPYFIDVYLKASEETNEDGMRNLSRFIDRLFCQLFHSTAQLRELESVFTERHTSTRLQRRQLESTLRTDASCVEWLMVFLLEKLNVLFQSTMRSAIVQWRPGTMATSSASTDDGAEQDAAAVAPVVQAIQVVDCSRSVFKKRIYARLCSDLRTLLVHPEITAQSVLNSFRSLGDESKLHAGSLYGKFIQTFELLQQMDLQQRHVLQHVEYESQNWTFAFVADYELKLLLSAFLSGIPSCFSTDVWAMSECGKPGSSVVAEGSRVNPMQKGAFQPSALARALLQPLQSALSSWAHRNGCPEWKQDQGDDALCGSSALESVASFYERGSFASSGASGRINTKSYHLPLHHVYASMVHVLSHVVHPDSASTWLEMLGARDGDSSRQCRDLAFWYEAVNHPLRVLLFSREIKAGMWVRNGNVMLQQLTHYHSKHWRYYGLYSDMFICQLAATVVPEGSFTRVLMQQFPLTIVDSLAQRIRVNDSESHGLRAQERKSEHEITALREAESSKEERVSRQQLDLTEEMFRLVQQLVLTPVKIAHAASSSDGAVCLLEREMRHWLSLGPFSRSEVVSRTDMKLLEQIKQSAGHDWAELEDEEILSKVLDTVGDYEEPVTKRKLSGAGLVGGGGNALLGFGLKMTGTWKLKPELWTCVSPLFESFTPSEAQVCEQNIRKYRSKGDDKHSSLVLPVLPSAASTDEDDVMTRVLAERILNSDDLLSVVLILLQSFRSERTASSRSGDWKSESPATAPKITDSLLLEVLNTLYVGVQLLEPSSNFEDSTVDAAGVAEADAADSVMDGWTAEKLASRYRKSASFFDKLCLELPVDQVGGVSVLSALFLVQTQKSGVEDVDITAELIVNLAASKSETCQSYMARLRNHRSICRAESIDGIKDSTNASMSGGSPATDGESCQDSKKQAREMMRRRQQLILEKMRSQQMQFLSSHADPSDADGPSEKPQLGGSNPNDAESEHDESQEEDEEDGEEEGEEEEEDEWGFPTGHVDVDIYLDHISSALTAMCEQNNLFAGNGSGKPHRRRSLRRNSLNADTGSSLHPRNGLGRRGSEIAGEREEGEGTEECGLCRLPCDPRSVEASFGLVGMILPSKLSQKMTQATNSSKTSEYFKSAPALRVILPGSNEAVRLHLNDAVVWSCGHSIHHACLKSYLTSLWKQKAHRAAFELVGGDERLLCERDMEFVCPICRRLSNCLLPNVSASLAPLQRTYSRASQSLDSVGSFDAMDLESEREETKDDGMTNEDVDVPDPVAFLPWLDAQMSFRDDCPQVKRRRSRAMSSLMMRQPSLSSTASSLNSDNERNVTLERAIGAFCHEIVLLSARAQLHLPLLMKGAGGDDDESTVEVELQQIGSEVGAQTPAWHLLLRCLEVQVAIVLREKQLLGGDDAPVDKWQMKSMRQIAQVAVAAAAVSAHSSLAWTVIDAPSNKRFELFMAKLNGVLFGQQVLFEEKDDASEDSAAPSDISIYGDWVEEVLVGSPLLAHPNLFACYMLRLVWKLCGMQTRPGARSRTHDATDEMVREAFYSARILVTAKVLQALCCAHLHLSSAGDEDRASRDGDVLSEAIDDFDDVESLKDAYTWTWRLMSRTRLAPLRAPAAGNRHKWDASVVEDVVARVCLPLVQQVLLLMDVMLPLAGLQSPTDAHDGSSSCCSRTAPCAVCDGLYPDAAAPRASSAVVTLDRSLRKLHLPPLRLFFHRQTFPRSQRVLCQLWAAQLESKAAVCRRALSLRSLTSAGSPKAPWSPFALLPKASPAPSLDLRAHMQQLAARDVPARRDRILVDLPRVYMDLFMRFNRKPEGLCPTCQQLPQHPGICLLCGSVVCCFSPCCEVPAGGSDGGSGVGECTQHAQACGAGTGAFLLLRACTVVLFLGNERRCVWGSLYVDKNGEEDPYLRRGKALFLDAARLLTLETLLVSHAYSQNTAILANTSRRDGRRY